MLSGVDCLLIRETFFSSVKLTSRGHFSPSLLRKGILSVMLPRVIPTVAL
jgi:hypothetical protein